MKNVDRTTIKDSTGQFDGTLVNPEDAELISIGDIGIINLGGENAYIELPQGVLDNIDSLTVSTLVNWDGMRGGEWLYTFGQNDSRYLYFTPSYNADSSIRFGIATNGWWNEVSAKRPFNNEIK